MWLKYPLAALCLVAAAAVPAYAQAGADLAAPTRTAPVVGTAAAPAGVPVLAGVRHARHDRYDRVVFDFTGGTPGYRVEYAPLVGIGTGDPIPLTGPADLRIVFDGVDVARSRNLQTLNFRYPTLLQLRSGGGFEGRVLLGLGLADRVGFRVLRLTGPPRIAVDVAHQPTQPFGTARFQGGGGADVVSVAGARWGRHPGYDRLVLDLRTARYPLISVAYTRPDPNRIHIGLTGLRASGAVVSGPHQIHIGLPQLRAVSFNVYENGTVSAFADTSRRTGFRVMLLTHPTRIVVDVAH